MQSISPSEKNGDAVPCQYNEIFLPRTWLIWGNTDLTTLITGEFRVAFDRRYPAEHTADEKCTPTPDTKLEKQL